MYSLIQSLFSVDKNIKKRLPVKFLFLKFKKVDEKFCGLKKDSTFALAFEK